MEGPQHLTAELDDKEMGWAGQMPSRMGFSDLSFQLDVQKESLKVNRS